MKRFKINVINFLGPYDLIIKQSYDVYIYCNRFV